MLSKEERDRKVVENMGLVYHAAKEFKCPDGHFEDMIQEGMYGLVKAVNDFDKYDPNRATWATFALTYIRREMSAYLWQANNRSGMSASTTALKNHQRKDTEDWKRLSTVAASCDARYGEDEDGEMYIDLVACHDDTYDIYDIAFHADLEAALNRLPEGERAVVMKMYGIGCEPKTQTEIAREMGCSDTNVSRIYRKALALLRHPRIADTLRDYL